MRLVGRIYDPLGFLAPVTIKFKILYQKLCKSKLEWDCDLPEELLKEWRSLVADLKEAGPISIPRSYVCRVKGTPSSYTLCGFCDASTQAYAAVIYLVMESEINTEMKFLVSKTRLLLSRPRPRQYPDWSCSQLSYFPSSSLQ